MSLFELINKNFNFLLSKGFSINKYSINGEYFDHVVDLKSGKIGVRFVIDGSHILVDIGFIDQNPRYWFELSDIVYTYAPNIGEIYNFPDDQTSYINSASDQIERIVYLIKTYCMDFLLGDFSKIDQIKDAQTKRHVSNINYINSQINSLRK